MDKQQIRRKQIMFFFYCFTAVLFLSGSLFTAGCATERPDAPVTFAPENNNGQSTEENKASSSENEIPQKKNGYIFCYNDTEIAVDMPAAPVLEALGQAQSVFETESCATGDIIRTYSYGSFELDTYELDSAEYISCICFRDDTVETEEGVRLFMTKEQLLSVYGTAYEEKAGTISYCMDNMRLKFIIKDSEIISIQYCSMVTETMAVVPSYHVASANKK